MAMRNLLFIFTLLLTLNTYAQTPSEVLSDYQIENEAYDIENKKFLFVKATPKLRTANFHKGTPISHPKGQVISTFDLLELLKKNTDAITVNVLGSKKGKLVRREVIHGGYWAPGTGGTNSNSKDRLKESLDIIGATKDTPIAFYCLSAKCWLSYNAVLRASDLGYTNIYWYRGGIKAWEKAGLPFDQTAKVVLPN